MNAINQKMFTKVAVNKSLLKEYTSSKYSRVVYLNDGDEFQLQLFNPEQFVIAAKIYLNNDATSNMLVLRPGERVWLERYLDKPNKFKFSTYEIDGSSAAEHTAFYNGEIKVEFHKTIQKEKMAADSVTTITSDTYDWYGPAHIYYSSASLPQHEDTGILRTPANTSVCTVYVANNLIRESQHQSNVMTQRNDAVIPIVQQKKNIETGRVEEGGKSAQKFSYANYDFEPHSYKVEVIHILPASQKPVTSADLKKKYCANCGRKLSPKHKFCPYCGTKID